MSIQEEKRALRKLIKEKKKLWSAEQNHVASGRIFAGIEQLEAFRQAQTVLAYWSMPDEVHTHDFVLKWYLKKTIFLPLVVGDNLELRQFTGMQCMQQGVAFGILEPWQGPPAQADQVDFAVIPGVAFDRTGNRMGRGKAYYDKLLRNHQFFKAGVCFDFQLLERVPVEPTDIPMDAVLSF